MTKGFLSLSRFSRFGLVASVLVASVACRGQKSKNPPIHPVLNMDFQHHFKTQEGSSFFEDGRAMRPKVPGTIARGELVGSEELRTGKAGGEYLQESPLTVTTELVKRGQDRYEIFCTPCHGSAGYGDGIVTKRGNLPPPSFHDERIVQMPVGQLYESIQAGVRGNMPSYANRISVKDRWAVVAYMRALQMSQNADIDDIPEDVSREKGWK